MGSREDFIGFLLIKIPLNFKGKNQIKTEFDWGFGLDSTNSDFEFGTKSLIFHGVFLARYGHLARKLHIKFRRFRLNIRTSVIRNDFLLSRSILSLNCFRPWRNNSIFRTLLSKNWKAAGLIFKKIFGNYCGFGSETNEWELKKKTSRESSNVLLLWWTFQFTSTVFCSLPA